MRCSHAFLMRFFDERTERVRVWWWWWWWWSMHIIASSFSSVCIDENRTRVKVLMMRWCCSSSYCVKSFLTFNCRAKWLISSRIKRSTKTNRFRRIEEMHGCIEADDKVIDQCENNRTISHQWLKSSLSLMDDDDDDDDY